MKFALNYRSVIAFALYVSLLCGIAAPAAMARPVSFAPVADVASLAVSAPPNGAAVRTPSISSRAQSIMTRKAIGKYIPTDVTQRSTVGVKGFGTTRAQVGGPNGANVDEQVVDITNVPSQVSDEVDPYWTADEQFVYYVTNHDLTGGTNYQIQRTSPGSAPGQSVLQFTNEPAANHKFPIINSNGNQIAYTKSTDGTTYQLYVASIPVGTVDGVTGATIPTSTPSLTLGQTVNGHAILSVGRPAWLGATTVVFTAQLDNNVSDILTVDVGTGNIQQISASGADEENVTVSPDGNYIAFDSNATGYNPTAVPLQSTGTTTDGSRNIFIITTTGGGVEQVTGGAGSGVAGGVSSTEPAFSRNQPAQFINTDTQYYIAFSSNRQEGLDPHTGELTTTGAATAATVRGIFYIPVLVPSATGPPALQIEGTPPTTVPAAYSGITVTTPIVLDTVGISTNVSSLNVYDDEYPTWAPLINDIRLGFQSNRKGNSSTGFAAPVPNTPQNAHDLFIATLIDTTAPTLLRYDLSSATGEVVHINAGSAFQASTGTSIRNSSQGLRPGQTVFMTIRASDLESGIKSAYIEIKNPNSKYQSQAQHGGGVEHKEFLPDAFVDYESANGAFVPLYWQRAAVANPQATNVGWEWDAQVIGASDYQYYSHNNSSGNVFQNTFPLMYVPSVDDATAFSGTLFPAPLDKNGNNIWLKLQRLDKISPAMAAQYPGGSDGQGGVLYGASWTLPTESSDWYLDVVLYDNAINPFDATGSKSNWIIYDNVWGMSTAPALSPQPSDVLVVSDYALGQKFLGSRLSRLTTLGALANPDDNLPNQQFGAESYYTDSDVHRYPDGMAAPAAPGATNLRKWEGIDAGNPGGPFETGVVSSTSPSGPGNGGTPNTLGVGSYVDNLLTQTATRLPGEGPDGSDRYLPVTGQYSIWRILSRGPVPLDILNAYLPSTSPAPADIAAAPAETKLRSVTVANRIVVWASPFSATTFFGAGTINDLQTQTNLSNFVQAGGRLFIAGQDIADAIAGAGANPFLTSTLGVTFLSTNAAGAMTLTKTANTSTANLQYRIGVDAFGGGANHAYSQGNGGGTPRSYSPPGSEALQLETLQDILPQSNWFGSASPTADSQQFTVGFNDTVVPTTATEVYQYATANGGLFFNTLASGGTAVFASFGFESLTEGTYNYTPTGAQAPTLAWRGRRAELMHNITCALRTGTVTGHVLDNNNNPVSGALIRVFASGVPTTGPATATGMTDGSGNYQVVGVPPGLIAVAVFAQGYQATTSTGSFPLNDVHGGSNATVNLVIKKSNPGSLSGIPVSKNRTNPDGSTRTAGGVFHSSDNNTPIPGLAVMAYYANLSPTGVLQYVGFETVTSDGTQRDNAGNLIPVGQYIFPQPLPVGQYQVVVNPTRVVDPKSGQLVPNTGQLTVTINGAAVTVPAPNPAFAEDVYAKLSEVGKTGPGVLGIDLQTQQGNTPATLLVANPSPTTDQPGDFVQIQENQNAGIDWRLTSGPQKITGQVLSENADGTAGPGVPNAIVQITLTGQTTVLGTATTDANGNFSLIYNNNTPGNTADDTPLFPEGAYTVSVQSANGYDLTTATSLRPSVNIAVGGLSTVTVQIIEPRDPANPLIHPGALIIKKLPPGAVSGLVTRVPGAVPVTGVTVNLYAADANGNRIDSDNNPANGVTPLYTTQTGVVQTDSSGYEFNFKFTQTGNYRTDGTNEPGIATGTYVADVFLKGFSPTPSLSATFAVTTGQETKNIDFTLQAPFIYGAGLQLISVPIDYANTTAATDPHLIFGLTPKGDNDGDGTPDTAADQALYNAFDVAEWTGTEPYNIGPDIPLNLGKGYFVNFGGETAVTDSDGTSVSGNTFVVDLAPGWNLIGHPFAPSNNAFALPNPIDLDSGTMFKGPSDAAFITFDAAVAKGYIQGVAFGYTGEPSNSQYFESNSLMPWAGYWFQNTSGAALQMEFLRPADPTSKAMAVGQKPLTNAEQEKITFRSITTKSAVDWRLQVSARQGDLLDTDNSVGVAPGATDGFDNQFDIEKPPVMTQVPQVYLSIDGTDKAGRAVALGDDIRSGTETGNGTRTWNISVRPASGKGDVTIFWPNVDRLPRGIQPFLVDTATGTRVPMRSGASSYTFTPSSDENSGKAVHRFTIQIAKPASLPLMLTGVRQTRVPSRSAGDTGGFRFNFTATQDAAVTAQIQTLTGRTVNQLSTRAVATVESSMLWNGRAADGSLIPAGAYILTLSATGTDGTVVQVRMPIISLR